MKTRRYYYLLIIIGCIMIVFFLNIIRKSIFKEIVFLDKKKEDLLMDSSTQHRKIYHLQDMEDLLKIQLSSKGIEDGHLFSTRIYYSRKGILHDLQDEVTLLYPPVPNQWLIDHDLDYSNPNILNEDSDNDGFTNLEEWAGEEPYQAPGTQSSDPNNPNSHPLLWTKLRGNINSLHKNNYYFDFIGTEKNNQGEYFLIQPQTPIPDKNTQGKNILTKKVKHLKIGERIADLPIVLSYYSNDETIYKDIHYDISTLTLRQSVTGESWSLVRKSSFHPQSSLVSITDAITFNYKLKSSAQKIYAINRSFFKLEDLEASESEIYQLIRLDSKEAVVERNGHHYSIPITNEFNNL